MTVIDPYAELQDQGPVRFLRRLSPLAKLFGPLPVMIVLIFTRDVWAPFAFVVLGLVLLAIGTRLSIRTVLALALGLPAGVLVLSLSFGLWTDPDRASGTAVLFAVGTYSFTVGAWLIGLATAMRFAALLVLSLLSGLTTSAPDIIRSMVQQLRLPYRVGYTALAAFRFVPRFATELDTIRAAHRVRGVTGGRGPIAAVRRGLGYVVPLLAGAIRHAERVALAMDARAFGASPSRTERHVIRWRVRDTVFTIGFWIASIVILVALRPDFAFR